MAEVGHFEFWRVPEESAPNVHEFILLRLSGPRDKSDRHRQKSGDPRDCLRRLVMIQRAESRCLESGPLSEGPTRPAFRDSLVTRLLVMLWGLAPLLRVSGQGAVNVTTIAGNMLFNSGPPSNYGFVDGLGTAAVFWYPEGVAIDSGGTFALIVRRGARKENDFR